MFQLSRLEADTLPCCLLNNLLLIKRNRILESDTEVCVVIFSRSVREGE